MTVWQEGMIRLARSARVTGFAQRQAWLGGLARRFVGGPHANAARACATGLAPDGITASLLFLGKCVTDPALIARTVDQLQRGGSTLAKTVTAAGTAGTRLAMIASRRWCTDRAVARRSPARPLR
jgi:hypothetical protein